MLAADQNRDKWFNNDKTCWRSNPRYTICTVEDRYAWLRQMDNRSINLAGSKTLPLTENWRFNLRAEAFNLLNSPIYRAPQQPSPTRASACCQLSSSFPRLIQVSAKLIF